MRWKLDTPVPKNERMNRTPFGIAELAIPLSEALRRQW